MHTGNVSTNNQSLYTRIENIKQKTNSLIKQADSALSKIKPTSHNSSLFVSIQAYGKGVLKQLNDKDYIAHLDPSKLDEIQNRVDKYFQSLNVNPAQSIFTYS